MIEGRVTEAELYDNRSVVKQILDLRAKLDVAEDEIAALNTKLTAATMITEITGITCELKDATGTAEYLGGFVYKVGKFLIGNFDIKFSGIVLGTGTPRVEISGIPNVRVPIITQIRDSTGKHIGTLVHQNTGTMSFRMYQAPANNADFWMQFTSLIAE